MLGTCISALLLVVVLDAWATSGVRQGRVLASVGPVFSPPIIIFYFTCYSVLKNKKIVILQKLLSYNIKLELTRDRLRSFDFVRSFVTATCYCLNLHAIV